MSAPRRELMTTMPERLDWLWFIDFDLDDDIPDHSVLSKARSRSGTFKLFFEMIVCQCVEAGLVDGSKIFMDSSLIQAVYASNNSIIDMNSLKSQLNGHYQELEARLAELPEDWKGNGKLNRTHLSTTDPDASLVSKGKVRSQLSFKAHRAVDDKAEVITATAVTSGAVNEGHLLPDLTRIIHEALEEGQEIRFGKSRWLAVRFGRRECELVQSHYS